MLSFIFYTDNSRCFIQSIHFILSKYFENIDSFKDICIYTTPLGVPSGATVGPSLDKGGQLGIGLATPSCRKLIC